MTERFFLNAPPFSASNFYCYYFKSYCNIKLSYCIVDEGGTDVPLLFVTPDFLDDASCSTFAESLRSTNFQPLAGPAPAFMEECLVVAAPVILCCPPIKFDLVDVEVFPTVAVFFAAYCWL
jgi:hypothetical protein